MGEPNNIRCYTENQGLSGIFSFDKNISGIGTIYSNILSDTTKYCIQEPSVYANLKFKDSLLTQLSTYDYFDLETKYCDYGKYGYYFHKTKTFPSSEQYWKRDEEGNAHYLGQIHYDENENWNRIIAQNDTIIKLTMDDSDPILFHSTKNEIYIDGITITDPKYFFTEDYLILTKDRGLTSCFNEQSGAGLSCFSTENLEYTAKAEIKKGKIIKFTFGTPYSKHFTEISIGKEIVCKEKERREDCITTEFFDNGKIKSELYGNCNTKTGCSYTEYYNNGNVAIKYKGKALL